MNPADTLLQIEERLLDEACGRAGLAEIAGDVVAVRRQGCRTSLTAMCDDFGSGFVQPLRNGEADALR